jgi:hypothetical protein
MIMSTNNLDDINLKDYSFWLITISKKIQLSSLKFLKIENVYIKPYFWKFRIDRLINYP